MSVNPRRPMVCLLKLACGHSAKKKSAGGGSAHYCDKCRQRRTIIESQWVPATRANAS